MSEQFRSYVMRGATLMCDKGSHERKINLIYDHGWGIEIKDIEGENGKLHPFMLSKDTIVGDETAAGKVQQNVSWFGCCSGNIKGSEKICLKNPNNSNDPLAYGPKCKPQIVGEWQNIKNDIQIENGEVLSSPLVANSSYLTCACGGLITIKDSGAEYDGGKDRTTDAEN